MLGRLRWIALASLGAIAAIAACGDNKNRYDDDDESTIVSIGAGGTSAAGGATSSSFAASTSSSSAVTSSSTGGGMTGCAGATPLTLGSSVTDTIDPAGDDDHFVFSATAGEWIALFTIANPDDEPTFVDTVITLYANGGALELAESDDGVPRVSTDSELFYHVTQSGQYCVRVQEFSEWANMTPVGDPSFAYELYAIALDPFNVPPFNEDSDPNSANDTLQTAQPLTTEPDTLSGSFAYIAGMLTPGSDVDFYSFTTTSATLATDVYLMPEGTSGHGSTQGPGLVRLRNASGAVLAELDYQLGSPNLYFPTSASSGYRIEVTRPNTTVGANDFFFFKLSNLSSANDSESEPNDTAGQADVAPPNADGMFTRHFIQGSISPATETDYWSFSANGGQSLIVVCNAARVGSGLLGFTVTLRNASDTATLQTETESATQDLIWDTGGSMPLVTIPTSGTYYMKFTATGQKSGVLGAHYLCGLHLQ